MIQLFKTQRNFGEGFLIILLLLIQASRYLQVFVSGNEFQLLSVEPSLLSFIINTAVIYGSGILLNNIANRYQFVETSTHLPAAILFALTAFIPLGASIAPWLITFVLSLLILNKLIKAYQKERPGRNYFDSAFLLSIISLFNPQLSLLLLALVFCVFVLSMPNASYFKLLLIGFLFPIIIAVAGLSVLYITSPADFFSSIWQSLHSNFTNFIHFDINSVKLPTPILILLFIISYLFWQRRKPYLAHFQKPILQTSSIIILIGTIIAILFLNWQLSSFVAIIFALALLLTFFYFYTKTNLANVLFLLLIGFAIVYPWIKELNLNL